MKVREGFVSNSSTASFIVIFRTKEFCFREEVEQAVRLSDKWLDEYWDRVEVEEPAFSEIFLPREERKLGTTTVSCEPESRILTEIDEMTYSLDLYTSMFNDWMDVPTWKFVRMISEKKDSRFELISIVQTEEEYSTVEYSVTFNSTVWEMDNRDPAEGRFVGAVKRQREVDKEYKEYLKMMKETKTR